MSVAPNGYFDLNLAGLTANFNLGTSTADTASSAYSFVNNAMAMDTNFLGQSIAGSQGFLSNQISPVLSNITAQGRTMAGLLPTMFSNITAANNSIIGSLNSTIGSGLTTGNSVAQASIASSNNSSGGGSLCFITTAVCASRGLPDDCEELKVLRDFRDNFMLPRKQYRALIAQYYREAPRIVKAIDALPFSKGVYDFLYAKYIKVCLYLLAHGMNKAAMIVYADMFNFAARFVEQ